MEQILKDFVGGNLYDSSSLLLKRLHVVHTQEDPEPMLYSEYWDCSGPIPAYIQNVLSLTSNIYYIGEVCDESLSGNLNSSTLKVDIEKIREDAHYKNMMIFAIDIKENVSVSKSEYSTLTRAMNRLVLYSPVIVIFRHDSRLSIATCERTEYKQEWKKNEGEKIGKVHLLKDISCNHPHRGHLDILRSLDVAECKTFDALYAKWLKVFNSELLTKHFYEDLFAWYQWAVDPATKVTFPGDVCTQADDREDIDTRIIRLITRLMFVWFIKQKQLVPDQIFQTEYLEKILKDFNPQSKSEGNYYQAILQNLFFGTLNRPVIDEDGERRNFAKLAKKDSKNLYRYEELFNISEDEVIKLFSTVPYLNCGLFECLDKTKTLDGVTKAYNFDGFSRNANRFADGTFRQRAVIPNVLFFEPENGLFAIFEKYVFTIEENTPQEVQVALDPELLGKVFENLLGAYNPETKETARNQSGSFYTPREIVQYMVNESLVAHLKRTVGEELETQFRQLLDYSTDKVELTIEQKKAVMHALVTCKVLDPACGSGAFPMGMLQQMVHILKQVDPENEQWREVLLNMAVDESRKAFGLADEAERQKKLREIEETFNNSLNSPDYTRKLYLIESCIYGVDIQPIAMLITRLRFFITLVCEQNDIRYDCPEENFGIKTLPNLESKFVAANSLIDADIHQYNEDWTANEELALLKNELIAIRHRHFYTRKRSEKIRLLKEDEAKRTQIHQLINDLVGKPNEEKIAQAQAVIEQQMSLLPHYEGEDWAMMETEEQLDLFGPVEKKIVRFDRNKAKRDEIQRLIKRNQEIIAREYNKSTPQGFEAAVLQVTDWNPYDQNTVSPFLDIEWMFGLSDGFDIVIGNPPYIQLQADKGKLAGLYKDCKFKTFTKGGDIYCLFYERGHNLLKEGGTLCYITSNKWMRAGYGSNLRLFLTSLCNPLLLIDFGETHVFESACVMTNILAFRRETNTFKLQAVQAEYDFVDPNNIAQYFENKKMNCAFMESENWVVMPDSVRAIKKKVEEQGTPLENWDIDINYGIKTGYNPAFILTTNQRNEILADCVSEDERNRTKSLICPILRGKDVQKYRTNWNNTQLWLINTHNGIKVKTKGVNKTTPLDPIDINDYPSVKKHLDTFYQNLEKRSDRGDTPYNLRNCAYIKDFSKPKIIYPEITKYMPLYYDEDNLMISNTGYILVGQHISYLTAFLNSSLFKFCFKDDFAVLFGGARRMLKMYVECIPVKEVDDAIDKDFHKLVLDIQKEYTIEKDKYIDQKIFDLYGLSQEERDAIGYIDFHGSNDNEDEDE